MKICFVINRMGAGGAERTIAYLSDYFSQQADTEVELVIIKGESFYEVNPAVRQVLLNCNPSSGAFAKLRGFFHSAKLVRKHLKISRPNAVVAFFPEEVLRLYGLNRKLSFRLIGSERNNPHEWKGFGLLVVKFAYRQTDAMVFQTAGAKNFFSKKIQRKAAIIPNAVGNPYALNCPQIGIREKKISAMGRFYPQKDYPTLFKAFKVVSDRFPDYYLEIFGNGPLQADLLALARKLGIDQKVRFEVPCPDAIQRISNASCYVLSSVFEGMPNALMEAMAVGLPCVSTDCNFGPSELIKNEVNGLLVPVGDEVSLADAIIRFLENPEFAEACAKNAAVIKETHSIAKNAQKWFDFVGGKTNG